MRIPWLPGRGRHGPAARPLLDESLDLPLPVNPADPSHWPRLSALLDDLLDLPAPERQARLQAMATQHPADAAALRAMLDRMEHLDQSGFMNRGAPAAAGLGLGPGSGPALRSGERLGAYTLLRLLGEGGMGAVWLARRSDGRYDGEVAIKLLRTALVHAAARPRFEREGRILARLNHPHIARLLDAGLSERDQHPYLVIEYVDGLPIDTWCDTHAIGLPQRLALFADVLTAVAHAHERLVLHRDIKPANILVNAQGQVKLLDFGIARLVAEAGDAANADELTRLGGPAFTPQYAAPEQVQGGEATAATDVYALGVLLFRLLGGGHPTAHGGASTLEQMRSLVELPPPLLSKALLQLGGPKAARQARAVRGDIDTLVAKALKKRPEERYRNAAEMADDLRRWQQHLPLLAQPDGAAYRARRFLRRHWLPVGAACAVAVALTTGATLAALKAREATLARHQAEDLLGYMLGDLRDKLEPLGKLDLLDGVGQRAAAYYSGDNPAALDQPGLHQRAKALELLAGLSRERGRHAESLAEYQAALRSSALALARRPDGVDELLLHALGLQGLATLAWVDGRAKDAESAFAQSVALRQRAFALRPGDAAVRMALADGLQEQAAAWSDFGQCDRALPQFKQVLDLLQPLATQTPPTPKALAWIVNTRNWAANCEAGEGRHEAALALLSEQALTHAAAVRAGEGGMALDVDYSRSLRRASTSLLVLNRLAEAERLARQGVALLEAAVQRDPENVDTRRLLVLDQTGLGRILLLRARPAEAEGLGAQMRLHLQALAPVRRTHAQLRWATWPDALALLARLPTAGADDARALAELLDDAAAQLGKAEPDPILLAERSVLVEAAVALGDLQRRLGQGEAARQRWQQALDLHPPADGSELLLAMYQARAWLRLGQRERALALWARLPPQRAAHPMAQPLRRELGLP